MYPDAKLSVEKGVYIFQVYTDSPASKAGLKEGDIIISMEEKGIDTMTQLVNSLYQYKSGDMVKLKIIRAKNNSKEIINIKLENMSDVN
jgi:S1-C subfamily serine protease